MLTIRRILAVPIILLVVFTAPVIVLVGFVMDGHGLETFLDVIREIWPNEERS